MLTMVEDRPRAGSESRARRLAAYPSVRGVTPKPAVRLPTCREAALIRGRGAVVVAESAPTLDAAHIGENAQAWLRRWEPRGL